jgi:hypothetical protein
MKKAAYIAWIAAAVCSLAQAGGSAEPVTIESLKITGTTYTLVVVPTPANADDYMGSCSRFTVHGLYWYLDGAFLHQPKYLSREGHLAALAYLQEALEKRRIVNFGWMGSGLKPIDASKPCVVQSRALLLEDERTVGRAVLSFHNAI